MLQGSAGALGRTSNPTDVLILTLTFPPDGVATAHIMGELAVDLSRMGHRVRALSTSPHYNYDAVSQREQPRRPLLGPLITRSDLQGVPVLHIAMPPKRGLIWRRAASWLWFHAAALLLGRFSRPVPQVIIVPSPLLSLGLVAWLINIGRPSRYVYNVLELYPDIAVDMGYIRRPWAVRILKRLESFVYRHASAITTIGPTMQQKIKSRVEGRPVVVIPNPADIETMRPQPRSNKFSRLHGLEGRFVVSYAGNMGPCQGLEDVIAVASILREHPKLRFLFVGEGEEKANLRELAERMGARNVQFLPQQPYTLVPEIYAASDISLASLVGVIAADAIPSKVARIMACARPVVAMTPEGSDLAELIVRTGCGIIVPPGDVDALASAVLRLSDDPRLCEVMGQCGRAAAEAELSRTAAARAYDALITAGP